MSSSPILLNDEQMRRFITEGFLILNADFPEAFHRAMTDELSRVYEEEGNPGNNLLPRIREIQQVFDHPVITGALTSVLGPDYMLHAHRHGHYNAQPVAGGWHKDSYWGYSKMRNHHPWWAMVMYFPQDTPLELGPTGVMPGTQNYETRAFVPDETPGEACASGKAGTFALIHYDIWHRSTPNVLGNARYMLKFEFMRTAAPTAPSWNNQAATWTEPAGLKLPIARHETMWEETWNWLSGSIGSLADSATADGDQVEEHAKALEDTFEPNALNAAYELARYGERGIEELLKGLHHDRVDVSRLSAYGLSAAGPAAIDGLTEALLSEREETVKHAAFALGELRHLAESALPELGRLLSHSSASVRSTVAEAFGMIGGSSQGSVDELIRCLQDEDTQVRFTAGLSLSRLGSAAASAVPALADALEDDNRYVRAHALEALRYIGTEEAKDILIKSLFNARWCTTTTKANAFYP
ncbi:HEAT repeat domain-containing protein [Paenibacillus alkaliterrae]|uniref:HEAT repeat domain-containing protein n=1 Tax=Paenibacillus alkaliterrae TaxID=320909 RepID=UPI001F343E1D|nr:HEAT repeat domain-containing protein [Paenibacillus alkaliterrae]MCF2941004.1 HEAT repeat domain-containing protein [Paenibacillus alkaliterrae]